MHTELSELNSLDSLPRGHIYISICSILMKLKKGNNDCNIYAHRERRGVLKRCPCHCSQLFKSFEPKKTIRINEVTNESH